MDNSTGHADITDKLLRRFRKSKVLGPLRLTLGRRGVSTSIGWGPFRISLGSDKKVRRTVRPVPGVSDTEVIPAGAFGFMRSYRRVTATGQ